MAWVLFIVFGENINSSVVFDSAEYPDNSCILGEFPHGVYNLSII